MKDIFSIGCLLLILIFFCAFVVSALVNAPVLTVIIISLFVLFISLIASIHRSNKKNEIKADDAENTQKTITGKTPPSFYEPEKIFRSNLTDFRSDLSGTSGNVQTLTLTVETPDEFPEKIETKSPEIKVEIKPNESAILRFNRLKQRNALDQEILAAIEYLLDEVIPEHNCRRIVFTGTGDVFASGANLNEIFALNKENAREFALRGQDLMRKITEAKPVTIAAVNGVCFGGALDLALSCNVRIASPNAVFCHPGANLGIVTGWGGTQRLPRLVGEAKALEMFLTAKRVDAEEALRINLIDKISENLLEDALRF